MPTPRRNAAHTGSLLQRQTIPQPEPCGSGSSLYTREPAMRKKPARRATEDKRSDWQVDKCARGARTSKQGLCPPRLWRHEPQTKYNEGPPAKPVSFFPPLCTEGACPLFAHTSFLLIGTSLFLNPRTLRGGLYKKSPLQCSGLCFRFRRRSVYSAADPLSTSSQIVLYASYILPKYSLNLLSSSGFSLSMMA